MEEQRQNKEKIVPMSICTSCDVPWIRCKDLKHRSISCHFHHKAGFLDVCKDCRFRFACATSRGIRMTTKEKQDFFHNVRDK